MDKVAILLMFLFLWLSSFCQDGYSVVQYELGGVVPENQVKRMQRDVHGYYWIITVSGTLLRWNGKKFSPVSSPDLGIDLKTKFSNIYYNHKSELIFVSQGNHMAYTSLPDGRLKLYKEQRWMYGKRVPSLIDYFVLTKSRDELIVINKDSTIVDRFFNMLSTDKLMYQYAVDSSRSYFVMADNPVYYYNNGQLYEMPLKGNIATNGAWRIGKYFFVKNNDNYWLYEGEILIDSGRDPFLYSFNFLSVYALQFGNECLYMNYEKGIAKFSVSNNKLSWMNVFPVIPSFSLYNFYFDELAERIFIFDSQGGIKSYEKLLFNVSNRVAVSGKTAFYTLAKSMGKRVANIDFQAKLGFEANDYSFTAPIVPLRNGYLFYPSAPVFVLFDSLLRVRKRYPLRIKRIVRSAIAFKDNVYIAAKDLLVYNSNKETIDKVSLTGLTGVNADVKLLAKGNDNIMYAVIDSAIYSIDLLSSKAKFLCSLLKSDATYRSISFDAEFNCIFLTVSDYGVYCFDLVRNVLKHFPDSKYRALLSCHYVVRDKQGDFWMPTNNGLYLLLKKEFESFYYNNKNSPVLYRFGKANGIINDEFNGGFAGASLLDGDSLFMPSMNGVVGFDPLKIKKGVSNFGNANLILKEVFVDDSSIIVKDELLLSPSYKRCELFIDFPFINFPNAAFEYQVRGGEDTSWNLLTTESSVVLGRMLPGSYVITIRLKNGNTFNPVRVGIYIQQYWYKSAIAYFIYVLIVTGVIVLLYSWNISRIKSKALLEIDKNRRQLFTIISHDLRSPLKAYQGLADIISYLIKAGDYERVMSVAKQIDSTGVKLELLMSNLLNWNLLQEDKIRTRKETVDLLSVVNTHVEIYRELASLKELNLLFFKKGLVSTNIVADSELVSLIIRNLLDNAIKNATFKSNVCIEIQTTDFGICLIVSNYFKSEFRERLNKIRLLISKSHKIKKLDQELTGLGIKMVRLAVMKVNGNFEIKIQGNNVQFKIHFKSAQAV